MTRMQRRIVKIRAIKKTAKYLLNSTESVWMKKYYLQNSLLSIKNFTKHEKDKVSIPAKKVKWFLDSELKRLQKL